MVWGTPRTSGRGHWTGWDKVNCPRCCCPQYWTAGRRGGLSSVILAVSLQATFLRAHTPRSPPPWHVENLWIIVGNPTTSLQPSTPLLSCAICLWTAVDESMGCEAHSTGSQQGVFRLLRSKDPGLPTDSTGPTVTMTKHISLIGTTSLPNVSVEYALLSGHGVRWPSALDLPS